jgi:hypothetical protein
MCSIWAAAWSFHAKDDPAAEDWVAGKALAVLRGRAGQAAEALAAQADARGLTDDRRAGVDACVRYLVNKQEYLRYDEALASGWPIATGVIEGAGRHLIGDRLHITGSRWGLEGAEAILRLRAVIDNGDFEAYWHSTCVASMTASTRRAAKTNTTSSPDRRSHCRRATPFGDWRNRGPRPELLLIVLIRQAE